MNLPRLVLSIVLPLAPAGILAQAPVISSSGDPSVQDDSIYALASDSTAYPDESVLTLFDDGIIIIQGDGTWSRTYRVVRQVLKQQAVQSLTELQLGYDAGHETFALNWARVVDPDSGLVNEEPLHMEELDVEVSREAPIYTDAKRVRISLGGVTRGRIVDYSYTVRDTAPHLSGDLWVGWNVNSGIPIRRSRYLLDVEEGAEPRQRGVNLSSPTAEYRRSGRWVREWSFSELPAIEAEPFAADSNGVAVSIATAGWVGWDDIAAWYAGLAGDRGNPTDAIRRKVAELVPDGAGTEEALRAIHRWVAQEVRYISISLGMGGYQPRPPEEVMESLSGDCKDKATLFVAMARAAGAEAYPVLVSTGGGVRTELPSIAQFNHMIAAVGFDGGWQYLDLTVPFAPFDAVYAGLQGETGILLRDGGRSEIVRFPQDPAEANRSVIKVEGEIGADGTFQGTYLEEVTGSIQYRIRSEFARSLTERQVESLGRGLGERVFADATADSVEYFDGRDLRAPPRLWARISAENVLQGSEGSRILPLRLPRYGNRQGLDELEDDTLRAFPIDAERVFGLREHYTEFRFVLPGGWTAELPESVAASSSFGEYEACYAQEGRTLVITKRIRGAQGVYPPDHLAELIQWLRTMYEDDVALIVLKG